MIVLPRRAVLWASVAVSVLMGLVAGLGGYTFIYARGGSYLTDDPSACANCHVMSQQFAGWQKSSHHAVAVCNDCHTPSGTVNKYFTKALNGWNHSSAFTTGNFHEPIQITARNRAITESTCRHCHADLTATLNGPHVGAETVSCLRCHNSVGHL